MKTSKEIKILEFKDAKEIGALHLLAFPNFFLTSLGEAFLKVFYEKILQSKHGFGIGILKDGKLIAFAIGTSRIKGFYMEMIKKNGFILFYYAFSTLITRPQSVLRILKNLLGNSNTPKPKEGGWLLSICTNPYFRGSGISQDCLRAFENLCLEKSIFHLWLTTDTEENDRANSFYKKMNYDLVSNFSNDSKRSMNLYTKKLKA